MKNYFMLITTILFSGCSTVTPPTSGISVELGTFVVSGSAVGMVEYSPDEDRAEQKESVVAIPLLVLVRNKSNRYYPIWHPSIEFSAEQIYFEFRTDKSDEILRCHRIPQKKYTGEVNTYQIAPGQIGVIPISFSADKWSIPKDIRPKKWVYIRACVDGIYSEWIHVKFLVQVCGFFEETDPMRRSRLTIKTPESTAPGEL